MKQRMKKRKRQKRLNTRRLTEEISHAEIRKKPEDEVDEKKEHDATKMNGHAGVPITRNSIVENRRKPPIIPGINRSKSCRETRDNNAKEIRQSIKRRSSYRETLSQEMKEDIRKKYGLWEGNWENKQDIKHNFRRSKSFTDTNEDSKVNGKQDIVRRYSYSKTDHDAKQGINQNDKQDKKQGIRLSSNQMNFPQDTRGTLLDNRLSILLDVRRQNIEDIKQAINQVNLNINQPNSNQSRNEYNYQDTANPNFNEYSNQDMNENINQDRCDDTRDSFLSLNSSYESSIHGQSGTETDDTLVNVERTHH